jgi:oligopeptidase B
MFIGRLGRVVFLYVKSAPLEGGSSKMLTVRKINNSVSAALVIGACVFLIQACSEPTLSPPMAKVQPKVDTLHGDVRVDDYYWLRERESQEVLDYLNAENSYTDTIMSHTRQFQTDLFEELKGRINETDLTVPVRVDSFYYYSRTVEGLQYRIYCRKKGSLNGQEEVLLDVNLMAEGYSFFRLRDYYASPNHRLLAYSVDTAGNEIYTIYIKDLESGEILSDAITNSDGSCQWAADNRTLFYTTLDHTNRPDKLYRHVLGHDPKDDILMHHEKDPTYEVYIQKSKSREYLFLELWANASTEYRFLPTNRPTKKFMIIKERKPGIEYEINHHGDNFYMVTNEDATNFKLMVAPVTNLRRNSWQEVIPHRDSVLLQGVELFANHMVIYERENGLKQARVQNLTTGKSHYIDFPEPIYSFYPTGNLEFDTDILRFQYYSLVTPKTVYDYGMNDKKKILRKQYEVLGGYDQSEYTSERIFAKAGDGTMIPISMVYRKGTTKDGTTPLYLYGYGSYGFSMDPYFSTNRLTLLDRGVIYAVAHVRGGSEMGRWWYDQGKLLNKNNTFTDFIACAEHLIAEKYTSADRLAAGGGSAGGLLMGVIANMRPDLFHLIVADVPFVDVINTMMDPSIPLTTNEYTEWGNPEKKEFYDYMLAYSPYDNVEAKNYPNMLILAGLHDPRVQYWEPAKWTAKLRALKTDNNRLLLKTNMSAGHSGASGRYDYLKEYAFEYAFVLDLLGLAQ